MGFLIRTLLILLACGAVLIGVQVPGFVDQYEKRVDAHLIEARQALAPFRDIAERRHGGSLDDLIAHHAWSSDPTFRDEADVIRGLRDRVQYLERHALALDAPLHEQVRFMAMHGDTPLITETRQNYAFGILLDRTSVLSGLVAVLFVVIPLELLGGLFGLLRPRHPLRGH